MSKEFLCLTHLDGYTTRVRADVIVEYGELYDDDISTEDYNRANAEGFSEEKKIVGSYINLLPDADTSSSYVKESVGEIDFMLAQIGYSFHDTQDIDKDIPSPTPR